MLDSAGTLLLILQEKVLPVNGKTARFFDVPAADGRSAVVAGKELYMAIAVIQATKGKAPAIKAS